MTPVFRLLLCVQVVLFSGYLYAEGTLSHVQGDSGNPNLLNIVFLAEAYTSEQEPAFISDVSKVTEYLFSQTPYKQYFSYFNVWRIFVESRENGASHPLENITRDTYFGATFGTSIARLVTFTGYTKAYDLLAEHVPDFDVACLLVNDTMYGGSGGAIAVTTRNTASPRIAIHEIGHSLARLADEYESDGGVQPAESYNVTSFTTREQISWKSWILAQTPLPTPETAEYADVVGLFEGAMYRSKGWYRPKLQCMMQTLSAPFCEVCVEAHISRFYSRFSPVKNWSPHDTGIVYSGKATVFSIETTTPRSPAIEIVWLADQRVIGYGDSLPMQKITLEKGSHKISAVVKDTTPLVRNPAVLQVLADTISWNVDYTTRVNSGKINGAETGPVMATIVNKKVIISNMGTGQGVFRVAFYTLQGRLVASQMVPGVVDNSGKIQVSLPEIRCGTYILSIRAMCSTGKEYRVRFPITGNE